MPILMVALLALAAFGMIGILLLTAMILAFGTAGSAVSGAIGGLIGRAMGGTATA